MKANWLILLAALALSAHRTSCEVKLFGFNDTPAILSIVKNYLPENPVIVEAGAFDGTDTLIMSNSWPQGSLHAFEPLPGPYDQLLQKIAGRTNIKTYKLALGEKKGIATFFVSTFISGEDALSSSLLEPKEHVIHYPDIKFQKTIDVNTVTLDGWARENSVSKIDLLWLDLQGFELNVLKASPEMVKTVKAIYTEVEFIEAYKNQYLYKDIVAWMSEHGFVEVARDFTVETATKPSYVPGEMFWGNSLFVRQAN